MIGAPTPQRFDVSKAVDIQHPECLVTVGFDRSNNSITRFLVRLHYLESATPLEWEAIARFDHNEADKDGHDIYDEGLHIDVAVRAGGEVKVYPHHGPLPLNRGAVIRRCVEYFDQHAQRFVDIYEGGLSPGSPPPWPDGGELSPMLFTGKRIEGDMSSESRGADMVSKEELSEILADATGTSAEEIERGAEELEMTAPEDSEIVFDE